MHQFEQISFLADFHFLADFIGDFMKKQILSALVALGFSALPVMAQDSDVMVVFDASGSMWGQIDGRTKIEIAREAFSDLSYEWAASGVNVGLIAYGHRRKGDCGDIELIAEPAPGSTARLGDLLQTLTPRGKTPLSDAVLLAAQTLKFTENAATVVLISDGRETCGVKVCEAATELERLGVNFTANVIGFGVNDAEAREQLQCLAQNTGGRYFDAGNAAALADALGQVAALDTSVVQVQETAMPMVALSVGIIEANGTARPVQVSFLATNLDTGQVVELGGLRDAREVVSGLSAELPQGRWNIKVISEEGSGSIEVTLGGNRAVVDVPFAAFPLDFTLVDAGPYLFGIEQTMLLAPTANIQQNLQLIVAMFPAGSRNYSQRMDFSYQFGAVAGEVLEHRFDSPPVPGDYDIVVMRGNDLNDVIFRQTVTYEIGIEPSWLGARQGEAGTFMPVDISGVTNSFATLVLQKEGRKIWNSWYQSMISDEGIFMPLPSEEGEYSLVYQYKNAAGDWVEADFGTINVGAVVLEDDADAVAPPELSEEPAEAAALDIAYTCDQGLCQQEAPEFDLSWALPGGWSAEQPFYYTTAGGAEADLPTMNFYGPVERAEQFSVTLNPRQWSQSNGPCFYVGNGQLCLMGTFDGADSTAFNALRTSLREVVLSDKTLSAEDITKYFTDAQGGAN